MLHRENEIHWRNQEICIKCSSQTLSAKLSKCSLLEHISYIKNTAYVNLTKAIIFIKRNIMANVKLSSLFMICNKLSGNFNLFEWHFSIANVKLKGNFEIIGSVIPSIILDPYHRRTVAAGFDPSGPKLNYWYSYWNEWQTNGLIESNT